MFFKGSRYQKVPLAKTTDSAGREIRYTLTRFIIDPLAVRLLKGEFKQGDVVFVNATDGKLELSLEPEPMSVH